MENNILFKERYNAYLNLAQSKIAEARQKLNEIKILHHFVKEMYGENTNVNGNMLLIQNEASTENIRAKSEQIYNLIVRQLSTECTTLQGQLKYDGKNGEPKVNSFGKIKGTDNAEIVKQIEKISKIACFYYNEIITYTSRSQQDIDKLYSGSTVNCLSSFSYQKNTAVSFMDLINICCKVFDVTTEEKVHSEIFKSNLEKKVVDTLLEPVETNDQKHFTKLGLTYVRSTMLAIYRMYVPPLTFLNIIINSFNKTELELKESEIKKDLKCLDYCELLCKWVLEYPEDFHSKSTYDLIISFCKKIIQSDFILCWPFCYDILNKLKNRPKYDLDAIWGLSDNDILNKDEEYLFKIFGNDYEEEDTRYKVYDVEIDVDDDDLLLVSHKPAMGNNPTNLNRENKRTVFHYFFKNQKPANTEYLHSNQHLKKENYKNIFKLLRKKEYNEYSKNTAEKKEKICHINCFYNEFFSFKENEIALELTRVCWENWKQLSSRQLVRYTLTSEVKRKLFESKAPNAFEKVRRIILHSEYITVWASSMIVDHEIPETRAKMLIKLIKIAEELRKLNNFDMLISFMLAFESNTIKKLAATWSIVKKNREVYELYINLNNLMSLDKKSLSYRLALRTCRAERLPSFASLLHEFTAAEIGNKTFIDVKKENFKQPQLSSKKSNGKKFNSNDVTAFENLIEKNNKDKVDLSDIKSFSSSTPTFKDENHLSTKVNNKKNATKQLSDFMTAGSKQENTSSNNEQLEKAQKYVYPFATFSDFTYNTDTDEKKNLDINSKIINMQKFKILCRCLLILYESQKRPYIIPYNRLISDSIYRGLCKTHSDELFILESSFNFRKKMINAKKRGSLTSYQNSANNSDPDRCVTVLTRNQQELLARQYEPTSFNWGEHQYSPIIM